MGYKIVHDCFDWMFTELSAFPWKSSAHNSALPSRVDTGNAAFSSLEGLILRETVVYCGSFIPPKRQPILHSVVCRRCL